MSNYNRVLCDIVMNWTEKKNGILKTKLINMCILIFAPFFYKRHRTLYQKDWQPIFHIIHFIYSNNNCFQRLSSQRTRQYIYTMSVHLYNGYYNISLKIDALENSTELTDQCVCVGGGEHMDMLLRQVLLTVNEMR